MASLTIERMLIEDEAHVSGDPGSMTLAVRNDTLASLVSADGDYAPLQVNASGALYVSLDGGSLSLASEYAEDSAHTSGETGQFVLAVRQDLKGALSDDGDYTPFQMNASGELYVVDEAGNALLTTIDADTSSIATDAGTIVTNTGTIATNTGTIAGDTTSIDATLTALSKGEDDAHVSGDQGFQALAVRQDTLASSVSADGDYGSLKLNSVGRLYVDSSISSISLDSEYAEDAAHVSGDTGQFMLAVANHTQGALHSADGDYAALQVDDAGRLRVICDIDLTGDLVGDGEVDSEDPLKVGSHAYDQASVWGSIDAGDKANLASDLYRRILINDAPNIAVDANAVTVGLTEVNLSATPVAGRTRMIIQNNGNKSIFVGPTGVGIADGLEIGQKSSLSIEVGEAIDVFAISGTAGQDVRVWEMA